MTRLRVYQTEFDSFKTTLSDLCVAVNRPFNDDLARVFWEDLKRFPLTEIQQRAKLMRASGKRQFTSNDLRPETEPTPPANAYLPPPEFPKFHQFGQRCLLAFLMAAETTPSPQEMQQLVAEKNRLLRDFRQMDAEGVEIDTKEFRESLLKSFNRVMKQRVAA